MKNTVFIKTNVDLKIIDFRFLKTLLSASIFVLFLASDMLGQWSTNGSSTVYTTDKVGIGISLPSAKLDIVPGSNQIALELGRRSGKPNVKSSSDLLIMDSRGIGKYASINHYVDDDVILAYGNGNGGGKVGIGTKSPEVALHIKAAKPYTRYQDTDGGHKWEVGVFGNQKYFNITEISSGNYHNRLIIKEGGNVGIGTNDLPSGYKLAVDGKVICEEVKVQLSGSWPDYVFEKEYRLIPLEDLEKSIKKHKHLPGIPSAKEVEKEGITIGEMQRKMMEKIEELTLYIIQQQKEIEALKSKLEQNGG